MKQALFVPVAGLLAGLLFASPWAAAQVAGTTTTVGVSVTESTQAASGWSVKKTLMGKQVVSSSGAKIGKIEDLIISPDRNVSYVIVGAGGFIGIGRHDVAVPVSQIQNQNGKLVMAGATKESLKALPSFVYTDDSAMRSTFMARTEADMTRSRNDVIALEKKGSTLTGETKTKWEQQMMTVQTDLKGAEAKLTEMKAAASARWREFEAGMNTASTRLRQSIDKAST
ncbi:MAG: photosystem reaction center protein H [Burkholderiales bacterium PBB6]|nr:MAG: photosystem reaction center protein H [Burkholderiales bacterium PBB6]